MFKPRTREGLLIDDAVLIFRNFAGKEGKYNREGDRNFCVLLEPDAARELAETGWNVKYLRAREAEDVDQPYLQVSVSFRKIPPKVALVTRRGKTIIEEERMLGLLDDVEIAKVDLNINPYEWSVNGASGKKAYLKSLYLTVMEDPLDLRYAHIPEIGSGPVRLEIEAEVPETRAVSYDYEGEIIDIPQRELGR